MIVLIRHAHTNMAGHFCGHSDPALSELGLAQLEELNARVSRYRFTHVYSSDLQRTRQTAGAIATQYHLPVLVLESLREIGFGDWEGLTWDEIMARDSEYAQCWLNSYPALTAQNGEEFSDFVRRIQCAMELIANEVEEGCAAVVTHAGVIRTFRTRIAGSDETLDLSACDYGSCWEMFRHAGQWMAGAHINGPQAGCGMKAKR